MGDHPWRKVLEETWWTGTAGVQMNAGEDGWELLFQANDVDDLDQPREILAAAAPELYRALAACQAVLIGKGETWGDEATHAVDVADAALRKARGE